MPQHKPHIRTLPERSINDSAFDQPKIIWDISEFHGIFTASIPQPQFRAATKINDVVTFYEDPNDSAPYAQSVDGELQMIAPPNLGDISAIYSRRHPRFHPNRGKLYSASLFYPTGTNPDGDHEVGFANLDEADLSIYDGITMRVYQGKVYGRIHSLGLLRWEEEIELEILNAFGLDLENGHLVDIQAQLRNVGNIFWYLSDKVKGLSRPVLMYPGLNNYQTITVSSPAMHSIFLTRNAGVQSQLKSGCVDISTESSDIDIQEPFSFRNATDVSSVPTTGKVLFVVYVPFDYNNRLNTRDSQFYKVIVSSDKRSAFTCYRFSDITRLRKNGTPGDPIELTDFSPWQGGTSLQVIDNSSDLITDFQDSDLSAFLGGTVSAGETEPAEIPNPERILFYITHGDFLVVEGYSNIGAMKVESLLIGEEV